MDLEGRMRLSHGRSGAGLPPLQHFRLDLAVERPDRIIVQLLVGSQ